MSLREADDAAASDDALVAAAALGDERAFEDLYLRYRADVKVFCSRWLPDRHTAEDVTQETFLKAFRHIGDFERGRPMWPWLATIAKRLCIDELRDTNRRDALGRHLVHAADRGYDATSHEALARVERRRLNHVMSAALADLRPRDRKIFMLQSIKGWTHEEIAERQGMSVHAVRNVAWRARRRLRRSLRSERSWGWILVFRVPRVRRGSGGRWRRWRFRSWMDGRIEGAAVERAAAVVLGLATAGATFFGGAAPPARAHDAVAFGSLRTVPIREARVAASEGPLRWERRHNSRSGGPRPQRVGASVSFAGKRKGAAAPSGVTARVELQSTDGGRLVWYESDTTCGPPGGALLPDGSPITAVC